MKRELLLGNDFDAVEQEFIAALARAARWETSYNAPRYYARLRQALADVRGASDRLERFINTEDTEDRR